MITSLQLPDDPVLNGKRRAIFSACIDEGDRRIYLGEESSLLAIAGLDGSFSGLQTLNSPNTDAVAFEGSLGDLPLGIFAGPLPELGAVEETGDTLAGHSIFDIAVGREAVNEQGQRAFLALIVSSTGDGWHLSAKVFRGTANPRSAPRVDEQLSLFQGRPE